MKRGTRPRGKSRSRTTITWENLTGSRDVPLKLELRTLSALNRCSHTQVNDDNITNRSPRRKCFFDEGFSIQELRKLGFQQFPDKSFNVLLCLLGTVISTHPQHHKKSYLSILNLHLYLRICSTLLNFLVHEPPRTSVLYQVDCDI